MGNWVLIINTLQNVSQNKTRTIWSSKGTLYYQRFPTWTSERLCDNFDFEKINNVGQVKKTNGRPFAFLKRIVLLRIAHAFGTCHSHANHRHTKAMARVKFQRTINTTTLYQTSLDSLISYISLQK